MAFEDAGLDFPDTQCGYKGYRAAVAKDRVPAPRAERETWSAFCQALFATAEFRYLD